MPRRTISTRSLVLVVSLVLVATIGSGCTALQSAGKAVKAGADLVLPILCPRDEPCAATTPPDPPAASRPHAALSAATMATLNQPSIPVSVTNTITATVGGSTVGAAVPSTGQVVAGKSGAGTTTLLPVGVDGESNAPNDAVPVGGLVDGNPASNFEGLNVDSIGRARVDVAKIGDTVLPGSPIRSEAGTGSVGMVVQGELADGTAQPPLLDSSRRLVTDVVQPSWWDCAAGACSSTDTTLVAEMEAGGSAAASDLGMIAQGVDDAGNRQNLLVSTGRALRIAGAPVDDDDSDSVQIAGFNDAGTRRGLTVSDTRDLRVDGNGRYVTTGGCTEWGPTGADQSFTMTDLCASGTCKRMQVANLSLTGAVLIQVSSSTGSKGFCVPPSPSLAAPSTKDFSLWFRSIAAMYATTTGDPDGCNDVYTLADPAVLEVCGGE